MIISSKLTCFNFCFQFNGPSVFLNCFIYQSNLNNLMLDRVLNAPAQSYWFQVFPRKLHNIASAEELMSTPTSVFKFIVFKGPQKVEENKANIPIVFNDNQLDFQNNVQLNFSINPFLPSRKVDFFAKLYYFDPKENVNSEVGCLTIDSNKFVKSYKDQKMNFIQEKVKISEDYELEYEIFIEKSKVLLQRLVRETKGDLKAQTGSQGDTQQRSSIRGGDESSERSRGSKNYEENLVNKILISEKPKEQVAKIKRTDSIVSEQKSQKRLKSEQSKPEVKKGTLVRKNSQKSEQSIKMPQQNKRKLRTSREAELKGSRHLREVEAQQKNNTESKSGAESKDYIGLAKMIIFLIVSFFLIYNAMVPARKVSAPRKR